MVQYIQGPWAEFVQLSTYWHLAWDRPLMKCWEALEKPALHIAYIPAQETETKTVNRQ